MTDESLPSGVLKVAEECKRLAAGVRIAITRQCMDPCAKNVARCDLSDGALNAAIDQLAALASPPPQATGALSEPLTVLQYNAIPELCAIKPSLYESIVRAIERAHGITAASQVEPEDKHDL